MSIQSHTRSIVPVGLLLSFVLAASLIWCGDPACLSGASDHQCCSLLCSLMAKQHGSENGQESENSTECACVCHTPITPAAAVGTEHHLTAQDAAFEDLAAAPASVPRVIYHPPKS